MALIGALYVVRFLVHWDYPLYEPAALVLISVFTLLGCLVGGLAFVGRRLRLAVNVVGTLVLLSYGGFLLQAVLWLTGELQQMTWLAGFAKPTLQVLVLAVGVYLICMLLVALFMFLKARGSSVVLVVVAATLAATLIIPGRTASLYQVEGKLPTKRAVLPPFVMIVLDAHLGFAGFPDEMPEMKSARARVLESYQDFQVFEKAYSRYVYTHVSLTATFNFSVIGEPLAVTSPGVDPLRYILEKNRLIELLKQRGYAVSVIQSIHMDLCAGVADKCVSQPADQLTPIAQSSMPLTDRLEVLARLLTFPLFRTGIRSLYPLSAAPLFAEAVAEIEHNPTGLALIMHVMLPHDPYIYDADCRFTEPRHWVDYKLRSRRFQYRGFARQVGCATKQVGAIFDALRKQRQWREATVIVLGDHGSRLTRMENMHTRPDKMYGHVEVSETDKVDLFSTLFAIKRPDLEAGIESVPVEVQNAVAYFMGQRPALFDPDKTAVGWIGPERKMPLGAGYRPVRLPEMFQPGAK